MTLDLIQIQVESFSTSPAGDPSQLLMAPPPETSECDGLHYPVTHLSHPACCETLTTQPPEP
jgi:hypothetical protein